MSAQATRTRLAFVVHDPRVRETEVLIEVLHEPGETIPAIGSSIVLSAMVWRVEHVRHFLKAGRIEVWLVPYR